MINGWLRPLRKEAWSLAPDWRQAHKFMSTQAVAAGALAFALAEVLGAGPLVFKAIMYATAAMVLIAVFVKQPELEDEPDA